MSNHPFYLIITKNEVEFGQFCSYNFQYGQISSVNKYPMQFASNNNKRRKKQFKQKR